ncbi:BspA family leucine-rich repeat surface protein [Mycoplasma yeatsii]|uniref:Surface protein n=1 Tax=Mycoplasma yeatsii TaxID=51365 RepID=A0ABU0NF20_9MOLU|nr:BspA family leucine-rich repeat surface protein [Mycoplasma yeatsii]MDQ0568040.1 surface protein [Mycoplasma yeatsii]
MKLLGCLLLTFLSTPGLKLTTKVNNSNITTQNPSILIEEKQHKYNKSGTECIEIGYFKNHEGEWQIQHFPESVNKVPDKLPSHITSLRGAFRGNKNPKIKGIENWDTSNVTNMSHMFLFAEKFNQNIGNWGTSNVTDMSGMFSFAKNFNQPIGNWDTSNVTEIEKMFLGAEKFNQDISQWDISKITSLMQMFAGAEAFNSDVSNWNTSNVTNMSFMFAGARNFNQNISTKEVVKSDGTKYIAWDISKVTTIQNIFAGAENFNQDISNWNTSNVTNMRGVFWKAAKFNKPLTKWDTSNVTNMSLMFSDTSEFNQSISHFNTSNVTNMQHMFEDANSFNQDISNWNTSNVTNMSQMFAGTGSFNQNISKWDVSKVTDMNSMFTEARSFNQNISSWDTSNVTDMGYMFAEATNFEQDLSKLNVERVEEFEFFGNPDKFTLPNFPNFPPNKLREIIERSLSFRIPAGANIGKKFSFKDGVFYFFYNLYNDFDLIVKSKIEEDGVVLELDDGKKITNKDEQNYQWTIDNQNNALRLNFTYNESENKSHKVVFYITRHNEPKQFDEFFQEIRQPKQDSNLGLILGSSVGTTTGVVSIASTAISVMKRRKKNK